MTTIAFLVMLPVVAVIIMFISLLRLHLIQRAARRRIDRLNRRVPYIGDRR